MRKTSGYDAELLDYLTGEKEPDTKKALATIVAKEEVQHPEALEQRCWSLKMEES